MIQAITVINTFGESLRLELGKPEKSGFLVESIDGLGPEKSTINFTENASGDGAFFNSAKKSTKPIVINLKFIWHKDYTIEQLRLMTYKYFSVKTEIRLIIETDARAYTIETTVESNEPDIFSQSSGTVITLTAMFPYFSSNGYRENKFRGMESLFEFPFSNESINIPLLEMSAYRNSNVRTIIYEGNEKTGIVITMTFLGKTGDIGIYNLTANEMMSLNMSKIEKRIGGSVQIGDKIVICTEQGKKSAKLLRNKVEYNILNSILKDSSWLTLNSGSNTFSFVTKENDKNLEFKIENKVLYEGV